MRKSGKKYLNIQRIKIKISTEYKCFKKNTPFSEELEVRFT